MPIRQFKTCGYCESGLPLDQNGEVAEAETMPSPVGKDRLHVSCAFSFAPDVAVDDEADAAYERYVDREIGVS